MKHAWRSGRRRSAAVVAGFGLLIAAAGCGSDDEAAATTTSAAATTTSPTATTTGSSTGSTVSAAPVKASGEAVKIGYINLESPTVDQSDVRRGAEAAAKYANAELGGIAGRPVELVVCKTLGTAESSSSCANEMLAKNVSAVIVGAESFRAQIVPKLSDAGVPWIALNASDTIEDQRSPVFVLGAGVPGLNRGIAAYAKKQGWTDMVGFYLNTPSNVARIDSVIKPAFQQAGVNLSVVTYPADLADATPFVSDALSKKPQGYMIVGSAPQCIAIMKAMQSAGPNVKQVLFQQCVSTRVFEAMGANALNAAPIVDGLYSGADTPEGKLFHDKLAQYGESNLSPDGLAQNGWATTLSFVRALNKAGIKPTDITPKSVETAMKTVKDVPFALGAGETLTCDGKALDGFPNACSDSVFVIGIEGPSGRKLLDRLEV